MSLTEGINEIQTLLDQTKNEIEYLQVGRKASAPRARKHAQSIKNLAHNLRKSITSHVLTLPTKSRVRKESVKPKQIIQVDEVSKDLPKQIIQGDKLETVDETVPIVKKPRKKRVLKSLSYK
jgi:hypothetical protein